MLDAVKLDAPKTKSFVAIENALKIAGKKVLFVMPEFNENLFLSARNIEKAKVINVNELNTYAIMNSNVVVLLPESIAAIENTLNA